uniref:Uncharacterized protein n=1 Tax=Otolemur garnettii TaxID=30611 RepID=H0XHF9_OTOGA
FSALGTPKAGRGQTSP